MIKTSSVKKAFFLLSIATFIVFQSCKKEHLVKEETKTDTTVVIKPDTAVKATRLQLTQDSIFLYAKEVYLWNTSLPTYDVFNPRKFKSTANGATEIDHLDAELYALTRYAVNSTTNKPYEFHATSSGADAGYPKYSFIEDLTAKNPVAVVPKLKSSVDLLGNGYDFGIYPALYGSLQDYQIYLEAVYPGSDAAAKGLDRGDRITGINGKSIGSNYYSEIDGINNALFGDGVMSVTLNITKPNKSTTTVTLAKKSYRSSPIYKDSVYTAGTKKIGYMAYARFSNLTNSQSEFDRIFQKFAVQNVTDLIIDLRYNGGGYVETAEYLTNLIGPSSLAGSVMYAEYFNSTMQQGKATILKNQLLDNIHSYYDIPYDVASNTHKFKKIGSLGSISNVVFIVGGGTASASELVINSLKPYLNVKLVGQTSYGKPVGFFPVTIDKYDVYLSMFETRNSKGEGGYYSGMTPDYAVALNAPAYTFGDLREDSFKAAYNYIVNGNYAISSTKSSGAVLSTNRPAILQEAAASGFSNHEFKGMIERPGRLKN